VEGLIIQVVAFRSASTQLVQEQMQNLLGGNLALAAA
jgi:hypothetical protein